MERKMTLEIIKEIRAVPMTDIVVWKRTLKAIAEKYGIDKKEVVRIYHAKTPDELLDGIKED